MLNDLACELVARKGLPKGAAWEPKPGGNFDKNLDGIGEIIKLICTRMQNARYVRDPNKTFVLDDLEREFGILKNPAFTEAERRMVLDAKLNQAPGGGTADDLQDALDRAGFNLLVHKNDPAVDPALFLTQNFQMVAGGDNAYAGYTLDGINIDAYMGLLGGELLVNGSVFDQFPAYTMQAGGTFAYANNGNAVAGRFDSLTKVPIEYPVPTDSNDFPFVFFVGGAATRDGSGFLTDIEQGFVPTEREDELKRIILSIKPLYTWCGLIVTFT
jgi:hypothetical protein